MGLLTNDRCMPKRPCAVVLTSDDSTILSADKFGDVYALPLIPTEDPDAYSSKEPNQSVSPLSQSLPAANDKTVHSGRNKQALQHQLTITKKRPEKEAIEFEHTLLLGHVSMLTDITLSHSVRVDSNGNRKRDFIITADRDEHIRVSRGIPQAYIIEYYCLGHKQFIGRLCIPGWAPELLLSGGGDDDIFLWDWESGVLLDTLDIKAAVNAFLNTEMSPMDNHASDGQQEVLFSKKTGLQASHQSFSLRDHPAESKTQTFSIAISGLWSVPQYTDEDRQVLVACEG